MEFKILTDSCCNLPDKMIEDMDIEIISMTFMVDNVQHKSFLKGEKSDLARFYKMMREGKVITTSLPNLEEVQALICDQLDQGLDVLYIGFSSGLSSTFDSISLLMNRLKAEYPSRKLYAVDTLAASLGEGLLVYYASMLKDKGSSIEEVRDWLEEHKLHLAHWFTVDDLNYLYRGGRLSKTSAWAGSLLNIKPILHFDDKGHIVPVEKVRGRKKSIEAILQHLDNSANKPVCDQPIFIVHADCLQDAKYLAEQLKERFGVTETVTNCIDPVIGAHSGPGTLALFFLADER